MIINLYSLTKINILWAYKIKDIFNSIKNWLFQEIANATDK